MERAMPGDFDESKHPRANDGKFGAGGGGGGGGGGGAAGGAAKAKATIEKAKAAPSPKVEPPPPVAPKQEHATPAAAINARAREIKQDANRARAAAEDGDHEAANKHMEAAKEKDRGFRDFAREHIEGASPEHRQDAEWAADDWMSPVRGVEGYMRELAQKPTPTRDPGQMSHTQYNALAESFVNTTTPDQVFAVTNYSNSTDRILNPALRAGRGTVDPDAGLYEGEHAHREIKRDPAQSGPKTFGNEMSQLDSAIAGQKVHQDTMVYRTLSDPDGKIMGDLKEGSTFTDHGYVSTTADKGFLDGYAERTQSVLPSRVDMHIKLKAGSSAAAMGHVSTFGASEKEMLLPRGTSFRVVRVVPATPTTAKQVHVEVSGDK